MLKKECDALNTVFFHYITTGTPYVVMKYAMTMDGKIACHTGESKWVTGEEARAHVQRMRNKYTGIMVGVQTVLADDPLLTCRIPGGRNPIRIICDSSLRTPLDSRIVQTAGEVRTILATVSEDADKIRNYEAHQVEVLVTAQKDGRVDLRDLMKKLGEQKIDSILLEGGGMLNYSALSDGIVQHVQAFIAPKLFGGDAGFTPVRGIGVDAPDQAWRLTDQKITSFGEDLLIEADICSCKG